MTTADYWNGLQFDYLTTYSLLRGPKWVQMQAAIRQQIQESRKLLLTAQGAQLLTARRRLELLHRKNNLDGNLLTEGLTEAYHLTASPVATLSCQSTKARELAAILAQPSHERQYLMCAPVFRDALAFYNAKHQLVAVLNVCLQCEQLYNEAGTEIKADTAVYPALRQWFEALGHKVGDEYGVNR
ncbi:hypothetical protein [Hymenobacter norwichensis]|uniref:hypothetical protein n=1 Tax=Hymenobacter norwichensis TaxID=223903 RepID=UPI00041FBF85|nr:hypothetical protein [Hymenobacter norwichensis]